MTVAPPAPHWQKGVQVRQRQERGRALAALHHPPVWTAGIIVATGLVLIARHPIARALGTEVAVAPVDVQTSAPVAPGIRGARVPSLSLPVAAVPTHAPVDPFRALVSAGGRLLAPVTLATTPRQASHGHPVPAGSCSAHRVAAGDTLWTIAARAVRSTDTGRVTFAWHRLYDANRAKIGADPSMLRVGATLCVPTSLSRR